MGYSIDNFRSSNRQAITTKYHGPTNTKGSRISATTGAGIRIYIGYDHALNIDQLYAKACAALVDHMAGDDANSPWHGQYVGGEIGNGVWAWVQVSK